MQQWPQARLELISIINPYFTRLLHQTSFENDILKISFFCKWELLVIDLQCLTCLTISSLSRGRKLRDSPLASWM